MTPGGARAAIAGRARRPIALPATAALVIAAALCAAACDDPPQPEPPADPPQPARTTAAVWTPVAPGAEVAAAADVLPDDWVVWREQPRAGTWDATEAVLPEADGGGLVLHGDTRGVERPESGDAGMTGHGIRTARALPLADLHVEVEFDLSGTDSPAYTYVSIHLCPEALDVESPMDRPNAIRAVLLGVARSPWQRHWRPSLQSWKGGGLHTLWPRSWPPDWDAGEEPVAFPGGGTARVTLRSILPEDRTEPGRFTLSVEHDGGVLEGSGEVRPHFDRAHVYIGMDMARNLPGRAVTVRDVRVSVPDAGGR